MINQLPTMTFIIPPEYQGQRFDKALSMLLPTHSRERIKQWIEAGRVHVNQQVLTRGRDSVRGGEAVVIDAQAEVLSVLPAQDVAFQVVVEDNEFLVVNKPAGVVVHPGAGNPDHTLVNGLLAKYPFLRELPRAGMIHRLDKDTSGLLLIAKTLTAHTYFVRALQARHIHREYDALVYGHVVAGGTVDMPLKRHPTQRTKIAVSLDGRPAVSHYRIHARFQDFTLLKVSLETGRTHQIRVHMAHIHHPIFGDPLYTRLVPRENYYPEHLYLLLKNFKRQALHASRLCFVHPQTMAPTEIKAAIPLDFQQVLDALTANEKHP